MISISRNFVILSGPIPKLSLEVAVSVLDILFRGNSTNYLDVHTRDIVNVPHNERNLHLVQIRGKGVERFLLLFERPKNMCFR